MSDGPHKSLPLRPRWKRIAQKIANETFTTNDLVGEVTDALRKDIPGKSLEALKAALLPAGQSYLFFDDQEAALNAILRARPGCSATIALVECAIEACLRSMTSEQVLTHAVAEAAREIFDARARALEEHYLREAGEPVGTFMRERCEAIGAGCDYRATAIRLLGIEGQASPRTRRRTGLDDGPALSA